jgi:hypothetical protein
LPALFKWGGRKSQPVASTPPADASDPVLTSKVLPKLLAALSSADSPVLLNLGPVIGQNISFFGDHLSCKIFVEDLYADIEAFHARGTTDGLAAALEARLSHAPASLDGILCWDVFDYLDRRTGQQLAARLVAMLKPGGLLYGFFTVRAADTAHYTRFVVDSAATLRLKTVPATRTVRTTLAPRDINKMFDGLTVAESVLLKTSSRETLFRKPLA